MQVSVPGNLLLLGEYAVLEPGGLGLAAAVEPRVTVEAEPDSTLSLTGTWSGGRDLFWSEERPQSSPLAVEAVAACRAHLRSLGKRVAGARIHVDSRPLYLEGRKGGLGSSAAIAVGLVWILLTLSGEAPQPRTASRLALEAHRRAQGGRGSGYDVLASSFGGVGLFTGGPRPDWQPLRLDWLNPLFLVHGPQSVATAQAIECYRQWRAREPKEAEAFLSGSNRCVLGFLRSRNRREAAAWLERSRELGLRLGERIGVRAALEAPGPAARCVCKALGAGNELGLVFPVSDLDPPDAGLRPLHIAAEGPRCSA